MQTTDEDPRYKLVLEVLEATEGFTRENQAARLVAALRLEDRAMRVEADRADAAEARSSVLEQKLERVKKAYESYMRVDGNGIEREEFEGAIAEVAEGHA